MNAILYIPGIAELNQMKKQLQVYGFIIAEDDTMQANQNHVPSAYLSNKKLISDIQLLPLLDYFFILYSSDLLHDVNKFMIVPEVLAKIGCENLCVDPKHLANIYNCIMRKQQV